MEPVLNAKETDLYYEKKPQLTNSSWVSVYNDLKLNLFLFRHVIKTEFGELKDIPRAKRKPYIPVVLSREEIDAVISKLSYPFGLIAKLLYGCGLRLFECMHLRINDVNFDTGMLTVHDGKGKKDRTVPLPEIKEYRRYYLHKTHVQKAIKRAVRKAKIPKRASAHTFRHSFASHLLQANYDIRTIQELLGHSDIRTTKSFNYIPEKL